ncbi:MAG: colicin immunity protein [Burkholderiaceae bacterium]|nr:colicin immunity protein [Burkholderiaceae bacterium]
MNQQRNTLLGSAEQFFAEGHSSIAKLHPDAAVQSCDAAAARDLLVVRIEGGIWHKPGFEARIDCIWDGVDTPVNPSEVLANNTRASEFIELQKAKHSAFILTLAPVTGYLHKSRSGHE